LDKDGNNLAGISIPGSSPAANYPGETGATTVPLLSAHTRDLNWQLPTTGASDANVSFTVRVKSDQAIAVGSDFQFSGFHAVPCSLLPK